MGPVLQIQVSLLGFLAYSCLWQDTEAVKCPTAWVLIGKYCYGYIEKPLAWLDAENDCHRYGREGYLASIHSHGEMKALAKYLLSNYNTAGHIWNGLYMPNSGWNREWTWVDESPADYLPWNTLEPNNLFFDENCVELYTYDLMYWNDNTCTRENPYVCKVLPS